MAKFLSRKRANIRFFNVGNELLCHNAHLHIYVYITKMLTNFWVAELCRKDKNKTTGLMGWQNTNVFLKLSNYWYLNSYWLGFFNVWNTLTYLLDNVSRKTQLSRRNWIEFHRSLKMTIHMNLLRRYHPEYIQFPYSHCYYCNGFHILFDLLEKTYRAQ